MTTAKQQAARDKAKELQEQLVARIEALTTSEDWIAALEVASRFHRYSFSNVMLILWQKPDATRVAGFRKWQEMGRQVRKGEKAIRILAPLTVKRKETADDGTENERRVLIGFRGVPVFDLSQTEGDAIPEVRPERLTGDAPALMLGEVADLIRAEGYSANFDGEFLGDSKNGETDYALQAVTIRAGLDPAQATKTAVHELAHVRMHRPGMIEDRGSVEVEAESVAYIVCNALGLDTADYSLPYVAHWARGEVDKVRDTGTRVVKAAHTIIDELTSAAAEAQEGEAA